MQLLLPLREGCSQDTLAKGGLPLELAAIVLADVEALESLHVDAHLQSKGEGEEVRTVCLQLLEEIRAVTGSRSLAPKINPMIQWSLLIEMPDDALLCFST